MSYGKGVIPCVVITVFLFFSSFCWAQGSGTEADILEELKVMKERIRQLEAQLEQLKAKRQEASPTSTHYHPVKGLADRVKRIEEEIEKRPLIGEWAERISISGRIEAEANWSKTDYDDPGTRDEDSSDITLATVELGVDMDVSRHVAGHVLFLYEEDGTDGVEVDEGFIILDGKDRVPFYLNAGKMYVPFGWYESHFISDPVTLELGETNESGVRVGYVGEGLDVSVVLFNGDVEEGGEDDHVDGWVFGVSYEAAEGFLGEIGFSGGISYINNIGDSDGLGDQISGPIKDYVGGLAGFLSLDFGGSFFVEAEYVGALDEFGAGELGFDGGSAYRPEAWNFEVAWQVLEPLEVAVRYGGSEDGGDFLAESQWGAVGRWEFLPGATVALEYLHSEFENHDETDSITGQLAVEF